jgi:hypothetical protein
VLITGGERFASVLGLALPHLPRRSRAKDYFFRRHNSNTVAPIHYYSGDICGEWPVFGRDRNLLPTPAFVKRLFTTRLVINKSYDEAHFPAQQAS